MQGILECAIMAVNSRSPTINLLTLRAFPCLWITPWSGLLQLLHLLYTYLTLLRVLVQHVCGPILGYRLLFSGYRKFPLCRSFLTVDQLGGSLRRSIKISSNRLCGTSQNRGQKQATWKKLRHLQQSHFRGSRQSETL